MHFTLTECWPVKPKSPLGGFFISDCGSCGRGLNASAWTKDRYWGKVAVESERGGEASAPAANDWRVKRLRRTDL
jgi:hypothetical protein